VEAPASESCPIPKEAAPATADASVADPVTPIEEMTPLLDTAILSPSKDSPTVDKEIMDIQPMPLPTSPDTTTTNGQPEAESLSLHQPNTNAESTLNTNTSGLSEPDIISLLELIQKGKGFEEGSKPQHDKVAEVITAVRDASQSKEWTNLLRGIIILNICLGFLKGDVSETCYLAVCLTLTNDVRKKEANSQCITDHTNVSFGCSTVNRTTASHRTFKIVLRSLELKCVNG